MQRKWKEIKKLRPLAILLIFIGLITAGCSHTNPVMIEVNRLQSPTPWTHLDINKSKDDFSFVIVADNTNVGRTDIFEKAMDKINLLNPDFVMCVGDLIQGYNDSKEQIDNEWDEIERIIAILKSPFFYTVGNHDIWSELSVEEWKERFGPSYYHFRYKNVLFISLNSEIIRSYSGPKPGVEGEEGRSRMMAWIKEVLEENTDARWTFLLLHQPFWDSDPPPQWTQIEEMLGDRPFTVFAGHMHSYTSENRNGRDYITLATTGGSSDLRGIDYGEFDHVTLVNMTDEGPVIANLLFDGIHDKNMRTKTVRELVEAVEKAVTIESETSREQIFKKGTARIRIVNSTDRDINIKARFEESNDIEIEQRGSDIIVRPGETEIIELPMKGSQSRFYGALDPVQASFSLSVKKPDGNIFTKENDYQIYPETMYLCNSTKGDILVDGDLKEWGDLPFRSRLSSFSDNKEDGPPPLRFAVAYSSDHLYIAGEVLDDELFFSNELSHLDQDGLVINLDARPDPKRSANETLMSEVLAEESKKILFTSVGLMEEKTNEEFAEWFPGFPEGTLVGRASIAGGYTIEIAIPISYLDEIQGRPWEAFRLNVGVRDIDPSKGPDIPVRWWRPDRFGDNAIPASGTFVR